jgi:hypothetical protein
MRVAALVLRDVSATLGAGYEELITSTAFHHREFCEDYDTSVGQVIEDVQQYFHDVRISTTWPTCPRHPNHPMWIRGSAHGLSWYCERDGHVIAMVGDLDSVASEAPR